MRIGYLILGLVFVCLFSRADAKTETSTRTIEVSDGWEIDHSSERFLTTNGDGGTNEQFFECPQGQVLVYLAGWHGWHHLGHAGDYVNGIGFYCETFNSDGTGSGFAYQTSLDQNFPSEYGNRNGAIAFSGCPVNEFITGIHGRVGSYIDQLGVFCSDYVDAYFGNSTQMTGFGGEGGGAFSSQCLAGEIATGIWIKETFNGAYVDNLQLQCSPMVYALNNDSDSDLDGIRDLEEHEECHDDNSVSCYTNHRVLSESYAQVLDESHSHAQTLPEYDAHLNRLADGTLSCKNLIAELVASWNLENPGNLKEAVDHYGPCHPNENMGVVVYSGSEYSGDGTEIAPQEYGTKFLDWSTAASRQTSQDTSTKKRTSSRSLSLPVSSVRSVKVPNGSDLIMCISGLIETRECLTFSASHPNVMDAFTLDNQVSTTLSYLAVEVTDYSNSIKLGLLMGYLCGGNLDNDINDPDIVDQILNNSADCPTLSLHEQLIDVDSLHQVEKFRVRQFLNPFGHSEVTLSTAQCLNASGNLENCFDASDLPRPAVIEHVAPSSVANEQNRYLIQVDQSVNGLSPGLYYRLLPAGVNIDAVDDNTIYEMVPTQDLICLSNSSCQMSVFDESKMRLIGLVMEQSAGSDDFYIRNKCTLRPDSTLIDGASISTILSYSTLSENFRILLAKSYFNYNCDYDKDYVDYIASQQQDTSNAAYWGNFAMSLTHAAEDIGLLLAAEALLSPAVAYAWTAYGESLLAATGVGDLVAGSELIAGLADLAPYAGQIAVAGITINQTIQDGIRYSQCTTNSCRAEARTSLILDAYFIGDFAKHAYSAREPHPFDPPSNTLSTPLNETDQLLSDQADIFMADVRDEVETSRRFDGLGCGGFSPGTLRSTRSSGASCENIMDGWESDGLSDVSSVADDAEAGGVTANEAAAIRARLPNYQWRGTLNYASLSEWDLKAEFGRIANTEEGAREALEMVAYDSNYSGHLDLDRIQVGRVVNEDSTHGVTARAQNRLVNQDRIMPIEQRIDLSTSLFRPNVDIDGTLVNVSDQMHQYRVLDTASHELNHAVQNEFWPVAFTADMVDSRILPAGQDTLKTQFISEVNQAARNLMEIDSYYLNLQNANALRNTSGITLSAADLQILDQTELNTISQLLDYSQQLQGTTVGATLTYDTNGILPRNQIPNALTALSNHAETFLQNNFQGQINQAIYDDVLQQLQSFRDGLSP